MYLLALRIHMLLSLFSFFITRLFHLLSHSSLRFFSLIHSVPRLQGALALRIGKGRKMYYSSHPRPTSLAGKVKQKKKKEKKTNSIFCFPSPLLMLTTRPPFFILHARESFKSNYFFPPFFFLFLFCSPSSVCVFGVL